MSRKIIYLTAILTTFFLIFLTCLFLFIKKDINKINFPRIEGIPASFDSKKSINIVFAADKQYSKYLQVAIKSAIVNKNKGSYYNIYILGVNLNKKEIEELKNLEEEKVKINPIPLKLSLLNGIIKPKLNCHYVSKTDYFKFLIPVIFKDFDKILYLDCDILVLGDLSELYNIDIKDKYLAAVKRYDFKAKLKKDLYNCGVLLLNNKKLLEDNIAQELIDTANNNKKNTTLTQYPFNKVLKEEDIRLISPIYNNVIIEEMFNIDKYKQNYYPFEQDIKNYQDLVKRTIIIHFVGIQKPWHNPQVEFASSWFEYAHLINPNWKKEKRNIIKHLINTWAIVAKFVDYKNPIDFMRNFYYIFKDS